MNTEQRFMQQPDVRVVVGDHLQHLSGTLKSFKDFDLNDTLLLRSEIKKLKSFLQLLNMARGENAHLRVPKKTRKLYHYAGVVLKLKFHLSRINIYCETHSWPVPDGYTRHIAHTLELWKEKAAEVITEDLEEMKKEIGSVTPREFNSIGIDRFLDYTIFELQSLYILNNEEALQDIYKLLQDLLNNWFLIEERGAAFVTAFPSKENIKSCADLLDTFDKNCIDIALLRVYNEDGLPDWERKIVDRIEQQIVGENRLLQQVIYGKLNWINSIGKDKTLAIR